MPRYIESSLMTISIPRLIAVAIVVMCVQFFCIFTSSAFDAEKERDNPGYTESYGLVGVYASQVYRLRSKFSEHSYHGGLMAYLNVINSIYGNFAVGIDYEKLEPTSNFGQHNSSLTPADRAYTFRINDEPMAFNMLYMTASDVFNVWIGGGVVQNKMRIKIEDKKSGKECGDTITANPWGTDFVFGMELYLSKKVPVGFFYQVKDTKVGYRNYRLQGKDTYRYKGSVSCGDHDVYVDRSFGLDHLTYSIGLTYHFQP